MTKYRLVVGEVGNEQGHVIACSAKTDRGARRCLARALAAYDGDGWGRVEWSDKDNDWRPAKAEA